MNGDRLKRALRWFFGTRDSAGWPVILLALLLCLAILAAVGYYRGSAPKPMRPPAAR